MATRTHTHAEQMNAVMMEVEDLGRINLVPAADELRTVQRWLEQAQRQVNTGESTEYDLLDLVPSIQRKLSVALSRIGAAMEWEEAMMGRVSTLRGIAARGGNGAGEDSDAEAEEPRSPQNRLMLAPVPPVDLFAAAPAHGGFRRRRDALAQAEAEEEPDALPASQRLRRTIEFAH